MSKHKTSNGYEMSYRRIWKIILTKLQQLKNLLRRKPKVGSTSKDNSNGASSSLPGTNLNGSTTGQEQSAMEVSKEATKDFGNTQGQTVPIQEKRASLNVTEEKESIQKATNQNNSSMTHKCRETSSRGAMFEDTFASEGEETVDSHPLWCSETDEGETDIKPMNTSSSSSPFDASEEDYDDEEPEEDFAAQRELVGYTLISKIGQGAFSEVYRAIPLRDSSNPVHTSYKQVAVKVINKKKLSISEGNTRPKKNDGNASSKPTSREQVLKEIMIHKIVSSGENIVTFIDFKETESQYYIVQELLQGGEIFGEIVRLTYFSEDLARHVIRQLAVAVKHMHSLGIVHRDIKPENLLFEPIDFIPSKKQKLRKSDDPRTKKDEGLFRPGVGGGGIGVVKLADFGLSKQIFATNTTTPCGTVGYTAPEVVKDERYSTKVDMWGIGCVLYTVLCGFPPFYDEKIDTLTELISKGQYTFLRPWWDEISDGAKNAVRCLLEVDPDKRYDIDEFLNDPWLNSYDLTAEMELNRVRRHHTHNHTRKVYKKDSSLLYSPAAVAMRDAFDISNAVQREEEAKRITSGGHNLGALRELDEETTSSPFQNVEQQVFQLSLDSSTIIKRRNMNKAAAQ